MNGIIFQGVHAFPLAINLVASALVMVVGMRRRHYGALWRAVANTLAFLGVGHLSSDPETQAFIAIFLGSAMVVLAWRELQVARLREELYAVTRRG